MIKPNLLHHASAAAATPWLLRAGLVGRSSMAAVSRRASSSSSRPLSTRSIFAARLASTSKPSAVPAPQLMTPFFKANLSTSSKLRGQLLDADSIKKDKSEPDYAMHHDQYDQNDFDNIKLVRRPILNTTDRIAFGLSNFARWAFDIATRYPPHRKIFPELKPEEEALEVSTPPPITNKQAKQAQRAKQEPDALKSDNEAQLLTAEGLPQRMTLKEMRSRGLAFDGKSWLIRIVFLESIAGVPGFVAAVLRHLSSMRLLRRDNGWIATLLEEASNERQHLLVALKLYEPGLFMRLMLIVTQGVFFNALFVLYMISPRLAHSFVANLESEAVLTYTRIVEDIDAGRLPEFASCPAPAIAKDYWGLPATATLRDVMHSLRADEAGHRFVNGTLAELNPTDPNPFTYRRPGTELTGPKWGLTREEALEHFEREKQRKVEEIRRNKRDGGAGPDA